MEKIKVGELLAFPLTFLCLYTIGAYVSGILNPIEWNIIGRILHIFFSLLFGSIIAASMKD